MNYQKLTRGYMVCVVICGFACLANAVMRMPSDRLDLQFWVLAVFTVGFASRVTVQIPRFKSHISVSDTFIFLTLLLYGGELAIILAAVEAFVASWRFCKRHVTIWFNAAAMAIATTSVSFVLTLFDLMSASSPMGQLVSWSDFLTGLCVIALIQFLVNTFIASAHDSMNSGVDWLEIWKNKYVWSFLTYAFGAAGAGILVKLVYAVGIGALLAAVPIILFVLLAYKMYLKNVEMSIEQAERANQYAAELEIQKSALHESEVRFRNAFDFAPIGMALVSPEGRWLKVNHALSDILGYDESEFLSSDFQSMIIAEDLNLILSNLHALQAGLVANCQLEQRYRHGSGRVVWISLSVSSGGRLEGDKANLIFQMQDITARKLAEQQLKHAATHDTLTGLPNRGLFLSRLSDSLKRSHSDPDHMVSVLFIDLDHFKRVNDLHGHLAGDQLLIAISNRLKDCTRPGDVVSRLGGDEFTILVEGDHGHAEATAIAERIHESLAEPFPIGEAAITSSASIGILHASRSHITAEEMMRDADAAMYSAKRAGKARHEVFNESMLYVPTEQ